MGRMSVVNLKKGRREKEKESDKMALASALCVPVGREFVANERALFLGMVV